jgi:hypothetical protein
MSFDSSDVEVALETTNWETMFKAPKDTPFAVLLDNSAHLGHKVDNSTADDKTDVWVVVEVSGRFFKKTGYRERYYSTEWDGILTEVSPVSKTVTVYENF